MIAKRLSIALRVLVVVCQPTRQLAAERLAVHTYTVADGLAGDQVTAIVQDRQGLQLLVINLPGWLKRIMG